MVIEFGLVFQLDNQISYLYEEIINDKITPFIEFIDKNEFYCFIDFNVQLLQFMNWKYPNLLDKLIKNLKIGKIVFINKNNFELLKQFATSFQYILREHVLLSVNPEVRESFLG